MLDKISMVVDEISGPFHKELMILPSFLLTKGTYFNTFHLMTNIYYNLSYSIQKFCKYLSKKDFSQIVQKYLSFKNSKFVEFLEGNLKNNCK